MESTYFFIIPSISFIIGIALTALYFKNAMSYASTKEKDLQNQLSTLQNQFHTLESEAQNLSIQLAQISTKYETVVSDLQNENKLNFNLKDENQEEPQKIDENDIRYKHETDLTKKEKRELEKMKLASMGWKGKLQYIWAYYKPQMAAIVAVIAIAFFVKDLYENSKIHTALTVMVIDSYGTKQEEAE